MRKKLLCNVSAVAMMAGLFVVSAALPAQAVPPTDTHNFMPDDTEKTGVAPTSTGIILSDRFDGEDSTSHLTNVATSETTRVQWRLCSEGTVGADGTEELTQDQFDACTIVIGEDSSPNTPAGDPPAGVDEAYEFNWNIPGTEDGATRDVVAAACIGSGEDVENDPSPAADESNCVVDVENDVLLDDAQTATPLTTSGEITELCTADVGGPDTGTDLCTRGGAGAGTNAEVDARFFAFEHGDNVPNDGFVFRAMTSDDVDTLMWNLGLGDAETDPDASPDTGSCTSIFTGTNFQEWECEVPGTDVSPDAELHLTIEENNGGSGLCADPGGVDPDVDCDLDSHYVVSNERRPESVVATFHSDDDLLPEEQCDEPDTAEANNLGQFEPVLFCVDDQFGQPIDTDITFENGPGTPSSAGFEDSTEDCDDVSHDGDAAGVDEHCDGTTGDDGIAEVDASNPDNHDPGEPALTGVQNIIACVESEPDPEVAAHGCDDEPANMKDEVDKTWESNAIRVSLVFGNKDTSCQTGPTFRENQVGDEDDLLACTFDFFGNPTPTTGEDDGFLEWSIGAGNDDEVDTQYVGTPPSETDNEAEAVARIRAINPGSDNPTVCLRDEDTGEIVDPDTGCDSVQKNVTADGGPPPPPSRARSTLSIQHRFGPHRLIGGVTSRRDSCESAGRLVRVRRARPGRDPIIGSDRTNANGRYRVGHRRTKRPFRYYARVVRNASCRADNSPLTSRVR